MGAISGWGGRVNLNSTAMPVTRWTLNNRADAIDVTTMEHQGLYGGVSGVEEYDISFDCIYDTTLNPFLAIPNVNPGVSGGAVPSASVFSAVGLVLDRANSGTRSFTFPRVLLTDVQIDDEVRGVVRYSCQGKSTLGVAFVAGSTPVVGTTPIAPTANPG